MKKIILASTSPRRLEILKTLGINFEAISPDYDENIIGLSFSYEAIESIALNKGKSVLEKTDESALVISADTVVVLGNEVLGKPKDKDDAIKMLKKLNNKTHFVVTSIAIIDKDKNKELLESTTSYVTFNNLSENDILSYVEEFKPLDKAGSYGIQELPERFIQNIKGEFDNIVGLPTKTLIKMLQHITK